MSPWLSDLVLRSQSDERLVSLARAGHDRAFVVIVERYERRLLSFAGRLGAGGRAEDVVQQAFLSAFAALRAEREVSHLSGWLHQIVRNGVASIMAARTASELEPETSSSADLEDHVACRIEARALLAELARLPERQRDALVLTSLQGRSRTEAAVSLGTTEGAVRQMLHRARTSLRNAAGAILPMPLVSAAARGSIGGAHPGAAAAAVSGHTTRLMPAGAGGASVGGGVALKAGAVIAAGGLVAAGLAVSHHPLRPVPGIVAPAGKAEPQSTFSASVLDRVIPGAPLPAGGAQGLAAGSRVSGRAAIAGGVGSFAGSGRALGSAGRAGGRAGPSGSGTQGGKTGLGGGGGEGESSGSGSSGSLGSSGSSGSDGTGDSTSGSPGSGSSGSTDGGSTGSGSSDSGSTGSGSTGADSTSSSSTGSGSTGSGSTGSGSTGSGSTGSGSTGSGSTGASSGDTSGGGSSTVSSTSPTSTGD